MRFALLVVSILSVPASISAQPALLKRSPLADTPAEFESQIAEALAWEDGQLNHRNYPARPSAATKEEGKKIKGQKNRRSK